jgi:voltage-gated potassium channel
VTEHQSINKSLRQHVHETLEAGRVETPIGRIVDIALIVLISLNVIAVIMESVPSFHQDYEQSFLIFEICSVSIFAVEYVLRVWSVPEQTDLDANRGFISRVRYMLTPMALLDLIVILPFFLGFFFQMDLRVLRVLRLFRVFRLSRYSSSMSVLVHVLKEESANIGAAMFVLMMMIILAANIVYLAEHDAQPEAFGTIPDALWWAVITMTTIGYGDVIPVTVIGRVCGAGIGILSVGMVALPAGILASGFNDALHRRRQQFKEMVDDAFMDGVLDENELSGIREERDVLGLNEKQANAIIQEASNQTRVRLGSCPHCGKQIRG